MVEFITLKDPHLSFGFQNRIRKGYEKQVLSKLDFVQDYCQKNKIGKIIFTGDVFDSSKEDVWSFKKYRKNKRVLEMFTNNNIKLFSNVGNHDMFHGYENSEETIFGEMVHDNILNNITEEPISQAEDGNIIKIQGIDYSNDSNTILENLRVFDEQIFPGNKVYKVCILHSNITPGDVKHVTDFTYTNLKNSYPDIDMFICGHYHIGYPTTRLPRANGQKEAIFINNWNFTRVVRDYEVELDEHTPEFEHIQIRFDKINQEFITELKTVQVPFVPYKDAFISKVIDLLKKSKKEIFTFFASINFEDVKEDIKSTDEDLLVKIKTNNSFSSDGMIKATELLNEAKA